MSLFSSDAQHEDSGQLTFFEQPYDDIGSASSSLLQSVVNFFVPKKDSNGGSEEVLSNEGLTVVRPGLLNFHRRIPLSRKQSNQGSEVELRIRSLSAIINDLVKDPQGTDSKEQLLYSKQSKNNTADYNLSPCLDASKLRQYWMPDEQCHECYDCGEKFTTFRRKHHCRICGQIFCSRCCKQLLPGNIMGLPGMLRSCNFCWVSTFPEDNSSKHVPSSFSHRSNSPRIDSASIDDSSRFDGSMNENMLPTDLTLLGSHNIMQLDSNTSLKKITQTGLSPVHETIIEENDFVVRAPYNALRPLALLSPTKENSSTWKTSGYIFDAAPETLMPDVLANCPKSDSFQDSAQLHSLWRKITDEKQGIEFRGHRYRLRKYSNCITGQELIDWLIKNDVASDRVQGCAIGQALYDGKWLKPTVDVGGVFQDGYVLFQSGNILPNISDGNLIKIYPDHFANIPLDSSKVLQAFPRLEPTWVQEIKCEGDDEAENRANADDDPLESELTSSDAANVSNDVLLYSDEDKSISEKSIASLSSFVEIDEGNDVIKYTKTSLPEKAVHALAYRSCSILDQPQYDDSCLTRISADYLRNLIAWNEEYFTQPLGKPSSGWREVDLQSATAEFQDKRAYRWLREMYLRHNLALLRQLLSDKGLDVSWAKVLVPLAKHAAQNIVPNPDLNMDICHYFQIKKIPDEPGIVSEIVNGVVCTKNVVHRKMRPDIKNPSLLLLAIPLEYQRVHRKLSPLDPIVRQEREFYKHLISRITARQPQIVIVQCTVSHLAQDLLLQAGITLVINVKQSVMERIARSTEADIVYSIDQLLQARLGHCSRFFTKHHRISSYDGQRNVKSATKTLMYFDGCNPSYGCTAILRGRNSDISSSRNALRELSEVQSVLRFLVRAMYHARLELSYLIDQHNFGKLLRKHSSAKQMQLSRSESETDVKNPTDCGVEDKPVKTSSDAEADFPLTHSSNAAFLPMGFADSGAVCDKISTVPTPLNPCHFEESLISTLLCISPLVKPQIPFVFTSLCLNSSIQKFLPKNMFQSRNFSSKRSGCQKFPYKIGMNHNEQIQSRLSTLETLVPRDRLWLSPPNESRAVRRTEANGILASSTNTESNYEPDEFTMSMDEGTTIDSRKEEALDSSATWYSRQFKQLQSDRLRSSSDVSVQLCADAKLHSWEQRLLDMIVSPVTTLHNEERNEIVSARDAIKADIESIVESENAPCLHDFISISLTEPASFSGVKDLLASFRSQAGYQTPIPKPSLHCSERASKPPSSVNINHNEFQPAELEPPDCMDPANHQHICALFSSYCPQSPNAPYFCVQPWVVDIDFYHGNDITLGGFLERYCFRPSYHCPNATCRLPMVEHIRRFVHGNMCMTIVLKELSKPFQQTCIVTWNWDWVTKKSSDIKTLSRDSWSMSFAKYLELNLGQLAIPDWESSPNYLKGQLKQDILNEGWELRPTESFQYFLFRDIVAAFKCFPISVKEVEFPCFTLTNHCSAQACQVLGEFHENSPTYTGFNAIFESLGESIHETLQVIHDSIEASLFNKSISESLTDEVLAKRDEFYLDLSNSFVRGQTCLSEDLELLNCLLKSNCPLASQISALNSFEGDIIDDDELPLPDEAASEIMVKVLSLKCKLSEMVQEWNEKLADAHEKDRFSYWSSNSQIKSGTSPQSHKKHPESTSNGKRANAWLDTTYEEELEYGNSAKTDSEHKAKRDHSVSKLKDGVHSADKAVPYKRLSRTGSSVKFLVARLLPGNALLPPVPMPFPADEHYLLPECLTTNIVIRDAEPSSIIAYTLSSKNYKLATTRSPASDKNSVEKSASDPDLGKTSAAEDGKPIIHDQPQRCPAKGVLEDPEGPNLTSKVDQPIPEGLVETSRVNTSDCLPIPINSPHIEIQFSDATTRFYCKVYYAAFFANFRSKVLAGGETQFLQSLSRSAKWLASGGKSGSTFHKTRDDQFILKQMSYFELQSFLDFAPKYIEYMLSCIENQEATTISKILGIYRISFRNSVTSRSSKQDVLVIENLFYKKKILQIYDLKGSVKNRHIKESFSNDTRDVSSLAAYGDVVLQDANLLKMMCESPIYVHEHTKRLLINAINRDTKLLSQNLIMDYSLLVGIDENENLIVGIIDFIRTFTWDKKLEMVVKWSSSRSMPTVVSPELYRSRFCEAMVQYFQVVPDRWYGMHSE